MPEKTILDTIIEHKHGEVEIRKARRPLAEIQAALRDTSPPRDFEGALRRPDGRIAVIAEIKKASPSAGVIRADFDPVAIARIYEAHGASCLSVLTDERFFQGHDQYLVDVRAATTLPAIRKDFTIDPYQIYEARFLGADAVLLIVAALSPSQVTEYSALVRDLGMAALIEVHTEAEMEIALAARPSLIGINSRNLSTFVTDLNTVGRLAKMVPTGITLVAESGIKTSSDVAQVSKAGAQAILVGESLMRAPDIGEALRALIGEA